MSSVPRQARDLSVVSTADLPTHLADATANDVSLRRFLFGLPGVDPVGIEQRAAGLATRSIKTRIEARGHRPGDLDGRPHHPGRR